MGMVTLTQANKRTLAKRQKMVARKRDMSAPKAELPKVEPPKEPTLSELKVFADLIKSGHKAFIFSAAKAELDSRNRLTLGWVNGSEMANPLDALWNVKAVLTKLPTVEDAPADGYYIKTKTTDSGTVVQFFQAPKRADCKLTIADKVKWVNDGKPCAYRYGFSWKGAGTHRISTGEAKDRLVRKKYFDCDIEHRSINDIEGDYLVFAEYSAGDMD